MGLQEKNTPRRPLRLRGSLLQQDDRKAGAKNAAASTTTAAKVGIVAHATSSSGTVTNAVDVVAWRQSRNNIDDDDNNNEQCRWCLSACCPQKMTTLHGDCRWYWIPLSCCRGILAAGIWGEGVLSKSSRLFFFLSENSCRNALSQNSKLSVVIWQDRAPKILPRQFLIFAPPSTLIAIISKSARSWEDFRTLWRWNRSYWRR